MARRLLAGLLAAVAVLAGCGTARAPVTPGVVKVVAGARPRNMRFQYRDEPRPSARSAESAGIGPEEGNDQRDN